MNRKQLKRRLKKQDSIPVSQEHLRETVALCRKELDTVKPAPRIGFWQFMLRQIRFADKKKWAAQLLALLVLTWYMRMDIDKWIRDLPLGLAFLGILMALLSVTSIERSRQYRMLELELSTRMSVSRLLLAQMLRTGFSSLLVMAAVFGIVRAYAGYALPFLAFTVCTYLLMSVLFTGIVQLCRARGALLYCLFAGVLVFGLLLYLRIGYFSWIMLEASRYWWALCIPLGALYVIGIIAGLKRQNTLDWQVK